MNTASTRYERRQPTVVMRYCTTGTEAARPKPLAACTIDSTSPRLWTNAREIIGVSTTRPRQLAPTVMTTPYSAIRCHSAVTCALRARPAASSTPPISTSRRGPTRSTSTPTAGELAPVRSCEAE